MSAEQPDVDHGVAPGVPADPTRRSARAARAAAAGSPSVATVLAAHSTPPLASLIWASGLTVALTATITVGAFAGQLGALAGVLMAVALLASGWSTLLDLPSPRGTAAVVAAGGAGVALAVAGTRTEPRLTWVSAVLAATLVLSFVHQLARRDGRPRLVDSLTGTVTAVMALASLACVVALPETLPGARGVLTWALAVTVALVVPLVARLAGLPQGVVLPAGTAAAAVAGLACGVLLAGQGALAGLVCGTTAGFVALVVHALLSHQPAAGRAPAWVALAVAPMACAGVAGYLPLRLLLG